MRAVPLVFASTLCISFACGSSDDSTSDDPLVPGSPDAAIAPQPDAAVDPPGQPDAAVETSLADDASDQSVIGSNNDFLNQNIPTEPNPDPSLSTVMLAPVDEPYDCDRAASEAASLFP
ncbi:MAG: hypothetical protein ACYTFZ_10625 [Planctomycetota bacterium]|jgi:hypothetical protein